MNASRVNPTQLVEEVHDGWLVHLGKVECTMLQRAISDVFMLIDSSQLDLAVLSSVTELYDEPAFPPENEALRIILPDMSTDALDAQKLRALTEEGLRTEKADRLEWMAEHLVAVHDDAPLFIDDDDAWTWLSGLNDVRLALAATLHLTVGQRMEQATSAGRTLSKSQRELMDRIAQNTSRPASKSPLGREDVIVRALYELLTTWQNSLLASMEARQLGALG